MKVSVERVCQDRQYRAADGTTLRYLEYGDASCSNISGGSRAPSVVMLHSLFFGGAMFDQALACLTEERHVICPDHRGQGASVRGTAPLSIAQLAQDTIELIERTAQGPVDLVGSSMGGYVAMVVADARPDLLRSCVLSCCTAHAERQPERFTALENALRDQGPASLVDTLLKTMFGDAFLNSSQSNTVQAVARWRAHFAALDRYVADAVQGVFSRPDYSGLLSRLTLPMLLISGAQDRAKSPSDMTYIEQHVANARHVVFEQAGHTPPVEMPNDYANELQQFWQTLN